MVLFLNISLLKLREKSIFHFLEFSDPVFKVICIFLRSCNFGLILVLDLVRVVVQTLCPQFLSLLFLKVHVLYRIVSFLLVWVFEVCNGGSNFLRHVFHLSSHFDILSLDLLLICSYGPNSLLPLRLEPYSRVFLFLLYHCLVSIFFFKILALLK